MDPLGTPLRILIDLETSATGYRHDRMIEGKITVIGAMPAGMSSGKPSIGMFVEIPGGKVVYAETSLSLFLTAADALKGAHGDPRKDDEPGAVA